MMGNTHSFVVEGSSSACVFFNCSKKGLHHWETSTLSTQCLRFWTVGWPEALTDENPILTPYNRVSVLKTLWPSCSVVRHMGPAESSGGISTTLFLLCSYSGDRSAHVWQVVSSLRVFSSLPCVTFVPPISWINNWKGCERKWSWPNLRYCLGILL